MKIKVTYSYSHEVGNYYNSVYKFRWLKHGREDVQEKLLKPLPKNFKKALKRTKNEKEAKEVIKRYLLDNIDQRKKAYLKIAKDLEKAYEREGEDIERKLEKLYEDVVPFDEINIYLSSLPIYPYNFKERWIMIYANTSVEKQLKILTHELNHVMFYYYFGHLLKGLGKEKFEHLKEALTIFTNPEERGYPAQKKLRQWLKRQKGSIPEIIRKGGWKLYV